MNPLENDNTKIEILRLNNDGLSKNKISEMIGVSRSTISDFLLGKTYKQWWADNPKPIAYGEFNDHHENIKELKNKRFIITSAQNNSYVHSKFLKSLERASKILDAKIIVGTFSYNTKGFQNLEKGEGEWFDPKIKDYIVDEPVKLCKGLIWCGELNILPTAANPLSGLHSYSKEMSGIIPHAKLSLESLPTHKTEPCRMMYTTGAVTLRNYVQKKTGQKASFHHVFGALLVEVDDDGDWFVRQLVADSDTGEFYDLNIKYSPYTADFSDIEAITWADVHSEKLDDEVLRGSVDSSNSDNILDSLRPKYQFIHDIHDFEARNHHNINDPYHNFLMYTSPEYTESVEENCMKSKDFLQDSKREFSKQVVVESNHDLALKRWLKESSFKTDPVNAIFYLECQLQIYKALQKGDRDFSILEWVLKKDDDSINDVKFLKTDESFMICNNNGGGIECGMHGDKGVSGSKGSAISFAKLGTRMNIGHSHTAKIVNGVYQSGHMMDVDKVDYAKGPSTWSASHIVTYPNGKRTIITMKGDKWHA